MGEKKRVFTKELKKKKEEEKTGFSVEKKIVAIEASKMPADQKRSYIDSLIGKPEMETKDVVTFSVYAKIRKIRKSFLSGMLAYPKAVGVKVATMKEWDEIFKGF